MSRIPIVLIVDDEREVELLFKIHFKEEVKKEQVKLFFVESAKEALEIITLLSNEICVVLSDINMPVMNGIELLKLIKKDYPLLPVYMVSAYTDSITKRSTERYGATGFFTKPVDFKALKAIIFEILKKEM